MRLHQLKVDYDAEQDRLLMLVATNEGVELRLVADAALRQAAVAAAGQAGRGGEPAHPHAGEPRGAQGAARPRARARGVEGGFLQALRRGRQPATPLGEAPLLLARIQTGHDRNGQPVVALHPAEGQGITLTFDSVLLHSVCRLLQAAVKKSDWDMELKLPGTEPQERRRARARAPSIDL